MAFRIPGWSTAGIDLNVYRMSLLDCLDAAGHDRKQGSFCNRAAPWLIRRRTQKGHRESCDAGDLGTGQSDVHLALQVGTLEFSLIVNDGEVDSQPSAITITVTAAPLPQALAGTDQTLGKRAIVDLVGSAPMRSTAS